MSVGPCPRRARPGAAIAVACCLVLGGASAWVSDGGFRRHAVSLDLGRQGPELVDPGALGPSPVAPVAWRSGVPLVVRAGALRPGDVVKLKAASLAGARLVELRVDGRPVARLPIGERWERHEVVIPHPGERLALVAVDGRTTAVHLARLSWTNVTGWVRGALDASVVHRVSPDLEPPGARRLLGGIALAALAMLAALRPGRRPRPGHRLAAAALRLGPGAAVVAVLALLRAAAPVVIVLGWRTTALLLLGPASGEAALVFVVSGVGAAKAALGARDRRTADASGRRRQRRAALAIGLLAMSWVAFRSSRLVQDSDPRYTLLVANALLERGSLALDGYLPRELAATDYRVGSVHGALVYTFPIGSSLLTAPLLAGVEALGRERVVDPAGAYSLAGELALQRELAAVLMALFVAVVYLTGRLVLSDGPAVCTALGAGFGTQVWSTASRALWSHTWSILLLGLVLYLVLSWRTRAAPPRPLTLAVLLCAMFVVRPTSAVAAVVVSAYMLRVHPRAAVRLVAAGALGLSAFVAWSWHSYGSLLPPYYQPGRLGFERFGEALLGNLVSPGRGLLVFVPAALPVLAGLAVLAWRSRHAALARAALAAVALHLVVVAGFWQWWGGHCYGPRLTSDLVPWLALGAVLTLAGLRRRRDRLPSAMVPSLLVTLAVLAAAGVAIHAVGANSTAAWRWNSDVDQRPEKVWDWSRPQFLAGWQRGENPVERLSLGPSAPAG